MKNIHSRSLASIEGNWKGKAPGEEDATFLVRRVYALYHTLIGDYEIDDIRFMIGQHFGLKHLVPLAFVYLNEDILTEGNYYPGDLLNSVLSAPKQFWQEHPALLSEACQILLRNKGTFEQLDLSAEAGRELVRKYKDFLLDHGKK